MRVFVTGASSFVDSLVVEDLLRARHSALGSARIDRAEEANSPGRSQTLYLAYPHHRGRQSRKQPPNSGTAELVADADCHPSPTSIMRMNGRPKGRQQRLLQILCRARHSGSRA